MATPPPAVRPRLFQSGNLTTRRLRVLGARPVGLRDVYHWLLRTSWTQVILLVAASFMVINALFGLLYFLVGGVASANPSHFIDYFFFSVQTFATIGYGAMYPQSNGAELVVTLESVVSVILNALLTGIAFAKFARPTSRVLWSQVAVVNDREGVPTLMFRCANERINHLVEATVRVAILRAERTREGEMLRRVIDLPLARHSTPSFLLTWTVMHHITKESPLYGLSLEALRKQDLEIVVTLTGLDETFGQTVHARYSYVPDEILFASRFADVIGLDPEEPSRRLLDYTKFHSTMPAPLTWEKMGLPEPTHIPSPDAPQPGPTT